jgi:hypothetical protein
MNVFDWLPELAAWAWDRHHNVLSWYIRPLFLLPFAWFAYRRNPWGIAATVVALATSMAWFPAPRTVDPAVVAMLDAEKEYLTGEWTAAEVAVALVVPLVFVALGTALWRRSLVWGLAVVNAGIGFKIVWTYVVGDSAGAAAHLVPAVLGLLVLNAVALGAAYLIRRRGASPAAVAHTYVPERATQPVGSVDQTVTVPARTTPSSVRESLESRWSARRSG